MSSQTEAQAQVLISKLLRSGDDGSLLLGPEARQVVALLIERGLVEIAPGNETLFWVQLKRLDRAGSGPLH